ncbi:MAG: hypothetical protein FJX34_05215 [Alphaproteobacteria bacterium]|nr:hypothetical protein [Alphaproteobacteria bacterium]
MPHLIIEHSKNFSQKVVRDLWSGVHKIMTEIPEGNFDPDQCKCRSHSFGKYFVGLHEEGDSAFLHITIKVLSGRSVEIRKKLATKTCELARDIFSKSEISTKRCDISVDVVEMEREIYQKIRI